MALSTTQNRVSYSGNGTTTAFSFPYLFFADGDLTVILVVDSTGVATTQTLTTDYTVSGAGEASGGTVTMNTAPASGETLVILRDVDQTQGVDLRENDSLPAEEVEEALDRSVMISQRLGEQITRTIKSSDGFTDTFNYTLPNDFNTANATIVVNPAGDGFAVGPTTTEIEDAEAEATAAANSATAAATSETNAEDWATKVDGIVDSTDYSSKAWSIGGTGVTDTASRGASKEWAIETASTVDGTEYSSKEYAQGTQTRGASGGGSAKDWATYLGGTVDDTEFSAKYYANQAQFASLPAFADDSAYETDKGTAAEEGDTYYNSTSNRVRTYDGSTWIDLQLTQQEFLSLEEQSSTQTTPASGTKLLYAKDDGKLYTLDSSGNEIEVGSGAGGGGVLYINEDFETGVDNLVAYADAAGTVPVDADGGTPNVTVTIESASPLVGDQSALITKDAANRQGEGVAILSSTVDEAYEDSVHTVEFLWKPDATVVADALKLFVVHPTTGTVEALNFRTILGEYTNSLPDDSTRTHRIVSELTPIDSTYKIVVHVAGTDTTAYTGLIDNIKVGPQRTFNGAITRSETIDLTGSGDFTGGSIRVDRTGNLVIVTVSDTLAFSSNANPESAVGALPVWARPPESLMINVGISSSSITRAEVESDGTFRIDNRNYSGTLTAITSVGPNLNISYTVNDGKGGAAFSTTQVDQTVVKAVYELTASTANTSFADNTFEVADFDSKVEDNTNAVQTGSSWKFTAPKTALYTISTNWVWVNSTSLDFTTGKITVNGADAAFHTIADASSNIVPGSVTTLKLLAGDELQIQFRSTNTVATNRSPFTSQTLCRVSIVEEIDFSVFGTGQTQFEIKQQISDTYTFTSSSIYGQLVNNSLTLTPGVWRLFGTLAFFGSSGYIFVGGGWFGANGANNGTIPASLSSLSNLSILSAGLLNSGLDTNRDLNGGGDFDQLYLEVRTFIVRVTAPTTVYMVPFAQMSTPASAQFRAALNAERIK